jgi:signal transduction histidine kinase
MAMQDRKGAWWFSTISGLFRFPTLESRFNLHLLPEVEVSRFFEDSVGDIWLGHWPKLERWERRSGVIHDESERLPPDARTGISAFAQDYGGAIWIGVTRGRLLRLRDGRFQPLSANWAGHINKLFVDSKGRLWVTSTERGLGVIDDPQSPDPQLRRYTRAQGLSADEVWSVTEDRLGRIYAGTAKGVDRLDPGTGRIVHYSTADGLVRGDIRSALRDRNGDLWFVSAHGVSRFQPSQEHAVTPARTRITALRIGGVPLPLSEFGESQLGPVRVPSHQRSVQIDFAATHYRTEAPLRYQFRLVRQGRADPKEGWQDPGTTSTVHLIDLARGDFDFNVRAVTPDGLSGEPASLAFSILVPFWQTWWFQLACAMAMAGIAWWIRTRRLKQQLALERVRSHIAMDLHDDIGAGLSRISVMGEALKSRLRDGDGDIPRMLDDIAGSSRQLVADMGDIVWSLDPGRDHVEDLATRLRAFGSDLLETRGVEWAVEGPAEDLHRSVPPALRRQFYLVFREGIHNIAKHAGARRATLRLWLQEGHLWGELTDDGCGIEPGHAHGTGIPSMRERVKQCGGDLEIATCAAGGTSIRLRVPLSGYA